MEILSKVKKLPFFKKGILDLIQRTTFYSHQIKNQQSTLGSPKTLNHSHSISLFIQLKDGKELKGQAFVTTPFALAKSISKNLAEASLVARIKYTKRCESPFGKGPVSA